jgi:hypothetical protein
MAAQSAVLVPVPEAERAVGGHRHRLDRAAARGVPAHVTVLYPFVPPSAITATVIAGLAGAVGSVSAFECEFAATAWFGEEVVWLAPRPDEPFRALTRAVSAAFPIPALWRRLCRRRSSSHRRGSACRWRERTAGSGSGRAALAAHRCAHQPGVAHDRQCGAGQLANGGRTGTGHWLTPPSTRGAAKWRVPRARTAWANRTGEDGRQLMSNSLPPQRNERTSALHSARRPVQPGSAASPASRATRSSAFRVA